MPERAQPRPRTSPRGTSSLPRTRRRRTHNLDVPNVRCDGCTARRSTPTARRSPGLRQFAFQLDATRSHRWRAPTAYRGVTAEAGSEFRPARPLVRRARSDLDSLIIRDLPNGRADRPRGCRSCCAVAPRGYSPNWRSDWYTPTSTSVSNVSRMPGAVMINLRRHPDSSSRSKTWPGRFEGCSGSGCHTCVTQPPSHRIVVATGRPSE
jgi:hypothetical protein